MRTVNIAELKNRLSTYVKYAKSGETVIIRDRNTAVAQLIPMPADPDLSDEERQLMADGILRPGRRPRDLSRLLSMPIARAKGNAAIQAVVDERNEGR